jgi:signal transduction histidine kinase
MIPWLIGRYLIQRRELLLAGWERADRLEHEQRIVAERARLLERSRIAQDMHDSLGHELSLIALMAANLEVAADLDERHRATAKQLRVAAGTATEHLQDVIGVLRADGDHEEPGAQTIEDMVQRATGTGLEVRLIAEGDPEDVPRMVERAAFRIVQESLTNAVKHAPGARGLARSTPSSPEVGRLHAAQTSDQL